jgi:hypothetical protein
MSEPNNGKRRGRPTTGQDPVVSVRLSHEVIADVDRLARTLGVSSRSEAIRYVVIRSAASVEPREIEDGLSLGLPTETRSRERARFLIEAFVREPGKWRASVRRSDGSKIRIGNIRFDRFITSVDTSTADQALQLARGAIDACSVQ